MDFWKVLGTGFGLFLGILIIALIFKIFSWIVGVFLPSLISKIRVRLRAGKPGAAKR